MPSTSKLPGLTSEESVKRLSTLEDGFSSRNSAVKDSMLMSASKLLRGSEEMGMDGSPKKMIDVAFDIKLTSNKSYKKNLLGSSKGSKHSDLAPL